MKKHVYLHIGVHKTASTTIQYGLRQNDDWLYERGYYVPHKGTGMRQHATHHQLIRDLRGDAIPELGGIDDVIAEMNTCGVDHIILSSENLVALEGDEHQILHDRFAPHADVTIVVYLKRQDQVFQTRWATHVFLGHERQPFSIELNEQPLYQYNYDEILSGWERAFGIENIRLNVFEDVIQQEHIFIDFLNRCGIHDTDGLEMPDRQNVTPSAKTLEVIRQISRRMGEEYDRRNFLEEKRHFYHNMVKYAEATGWNDTKLNLITPEMAEQVMAHYEASNRAVAQRYFGRDTLFTQPFKEKPLTPYDIEAMTQEEFLQVLAYLGEKMTLQQRAFFRMKRQRDSLEEQLNARYAKEVERLEAENQHLNQKLDGIIHTRGWRFLTRYWQLRDRVKGWLQR